ncbi:MAG: molybdopterin dinucleotide binding domain-containing protein, partial [Candidatus Binataceae bacterium]
YVAGYDPATVGDKTGVPAGTITRIAQIFGKSDGAVAMAGTEDKQTHIAAFILNAVTGNIGKTVQFAEGQPAPELSSREEVDGLIKAMHGKQIDVLMIAESNPIYSMPTAADFQGALRQVPFVIWAGGVPDETAARANLLLPLHHPLETWRDTAPRAGIRGLGQPVMVPVFESRELGDLMLSSAHAGGATAKQAPWENMMDAMSETWQQLATQAGVKGNPKDFWYQSLRDGGIFTEAKTSAVKLDTAVFKGAPGNIPSGAGLTLAAYPHMFLHDGRGADKPWLQEIPEPVAQVVWDSWAEIHPDTAKTLGISRNDVIELTTAQGKIEASALITEHVRAGIIAVPLGQGHSAYGRYAVGRGVNAFTVLPANSLSTAVTVRRTGRQDKLISPLFSEDMMGRNIVEAMSIEQLASGKAPPKKPLAPEPYEMYTHFKYPTHMWGMTIDANACTGCSSCVAACYAENNLYVVGKEEVDRGRIMSWIRVERYVPHKDKAAHAPQMYITPMLCQQCDQAPCEPVCPVFAAYHTQEGLNGQNYNRCVGTRYCENNCPYKVRRFNWVKPEWPAPLNLQLNPDVTVRGAGVMEKCTFCMQRIVAAEINAMVQDRKVRDGEILTACQEACPTYAISFGDMNDKNSEMMRRRADNKMRPYYVLEEFNTLPAIAYLRDIYHEKGRA